MVHPSPCLGATSAPPMPAACGPALVCVDVNPAACAATARTLRRNGAAATVLRGDLLAPLLPRSAGVLDLLLFNPPYVPSGGVGPDGARGAAAAPRSECQSRAVIIGSHLKTDPILESKSSPRSLPRAG